ncbi:MAG: 4-hydroxyphenylacetate degradation bifunctionali somerase/decarboxylase [Candidatus Aramenus sulfurataquae]|uniref:2-hydroxyhepta-2,4-diene-1,7-dioate isomerase n=2 Tax=Candidatus Aramenus sulfurataquae TaxID=1326980 RepID=W7KGQ0_9CREN|nr:MAG: 4-hydroxyphenylacetate degradation bifunctionali somerase/decarboxylase [Candidatus Aramenus sulfurataquae]MCL7344594.1 fumarylacetoacetate hydrolase family protein [Candidatus Aramenus sulfurataquae]
MKIIHFEVKGKKKIGELKGKDIVEMEDYFSEPKGESYSIDEVKQIPFYPTAIICTLTNSYIMTGAESKEEAREMLGSPKFFLKLPSIVIGNNDTVYSPKSGIRPEVEIGIVVKDNVKNLNISEIEKHILGYTVFNDVTAPEEFKKDWYYAKRRDPSDGQIKKMLIRGNHFRNKNRDTFAPVGSILITPDDIKIDKLRMKSIYGGKVIQDGSTDEFVFSIEEIISELSKIVTIPRLSLVATGTVGYSEAIEASEYKLMATNTIMEVEVEKIGKLTNPVKVED